MLGMLGGLIIAEATAFRGPPGLPVSRIPRVPLVTLVLWEVKGLQLTAKVTPVSTV
jgi:hypothetical protein